MAILLPNSATGPTISPNYNAAIQQGTQITLAVMIPGVTNGYVPVGYVQRVDQSDSYGSAGFYGIGQMEPFEIQPLQFTGQLTITGGVLYTQSWLGSLFGSAREILVSGALSIIVQDLAGNPFITYVGFVAQSYTASYAANAYTIQTATGQYRTIHLPTSANQWSGQRYTFSPASLPSSIANRAISG